MTMFKCICTSLMLLCVQIESLKLSGPAADAPGAQVPVADVNLEQNPTDFYTTELEIFEDHPDYPSDPGLEYVADSDGLSVQVNPLFVDNALDMDLENFEKQENGYRTYANRMLVVPKHKLAFCYIEKVGCTQFNLLLNRMNGIKTGSVWWRSNYNKFNLKLADITREKGWFRGIFLRAPRHRFLSAFNSKCLPGHDSDTDMCIVHALEGKHNRTAQESLFHRATENLETKYKGGNPHFDPMTHFCGGLSADLSDYDYVGHLDKGYADVQRQVTEMLGKAGIKFESDYAKIFPATKPGTKHVTNTIGEFDDFYKEADTKHVKDYYAPDYTLLAKLDQKKWRIR